MTSETEGQGGANHQQMEAPKEVIQYEVLTILEEISVRLERIESQLGSKKKQPRS